MPSAGPQTAEHRFQGVLLTAGPKTFTAETSIIITFNVAAATGGTGQLSANVYYVVE